jgi:hypothetical protein
MRFKFTSARILWQGVTYVRTPPPPPFPSLVSSARPDKPGPAPWARDPATPATGARSARPSLSMRRAGPTGRSLKVLGEDNRRAARDRRGKTTGEAWGAHSWNRSAPARAARASAAAGAGRRGGGGAAAECGARATTKRAWASAKTGPPGGPSVMRAVRETLRPCGGGGSDG